VRPKRGGAKGDRLGFIFTAKWPADVAAIAVAVSAQKKYNT